MLKSCLKQRQQEQQKSERMPRSASERCRALGSMFMLLLLSCSDSVLPSLSLSRRCSSRKVALSLGRIYIKKPQIKVAN
ncbi:hypothetical protein M5D96_004007 [Drosophila gunungcola]|uniref:Uncharacterized protein n=1 Tax=Drosophila gunungcola TaxID=103775 RepID=A0A9P9YTL4_9MUSC|nr:hypothetical protein M5D96_004007 [Drosophila gunungcola]